MKIFFLKNCNYCWCDANASTEWPETGSYRHFPSEKLVYSVITYIHSDKCEIIMGKDKFTTTKIKFKMRKYKFIMGKYKLIIWKYQLTLYQFTLSHYKFTFLKTILGTLLCLNVIIHRKFKFCEWNLISATQKCLSQREIIKCDLCTLPKYYFTLPITNLILLIMNL